MWFTRKPKRLYLDYAAATPLRSEAQGAMEPYLSDVYGNGSAIHAEGQAASKAVSQARLTIARTFAVREREVVFTGSGSEANNLAIIGYIEALKATGRAYQDMAVISTMIEHPSVLEVLRVLQSRGVVVHYVPVSKTGVIELGALTALLSPQIVLVTLAYVNSEIGVIQPVKRITRAVRAYCVASGTRVVVHVDAAQAPLWLPCQVSMLGVDMLALDAGKCGGPKGVGVLIKRHHVDLQPQVRGGGQEFGLRAGTENTAGIVGAAVALELAEKQHTVVAAKVRIRRDALLAALLKLPQVYLNGPEGEERVANNINISLVGYDSEYAVVALDAAGIAASTKSACSGAGGGGSTVVNAISGDAARATSTIRFTFGPDTPMGSREITRVVEALTAHQSLMGRFDSTPK